MNEGREVVITTITPNGGATLPFVTRANPDLLQCSTGQVRGCFSLDDKRRALFECTGTKAWG